jgi:hypothetical protein
MAGELESVDKKMLEVLRALEKGQKLPKPYGVEIYLHKTYIAGVQYYNAKKNIENIKEGNYLVFRREPENPYDSKAIMIMDLDGDKLGYIPRDDNGIISKLMDAGKTIYGIISNKKAVDNYMSIEIKVYLRDY